MVRNYQARILTARGPFRATLFLWMLSMVSEGMVVLPSTSLGVTSTGSHEMGVWHGNCQYRSLGCVVM